MSEPKGPYSHESLMAPKEQVPDWVLRGMAKSKQVPSEEPSGH